MRMKGKKPVFNYKDTWDLSVVLNPIIAAGLEKFIEVKNSEKSDFFGTPQGFKSDEEWDNALADMLYAFQYEVPDYEGEILIEFDDNEVVDISLEDKAHWWEYDALLKEQHSRVVRGRALFAAHYDALWW